MRAAIYARISKDDDERQGKGVRRQVEDLRQEALRRGATVTAVLEDNDLSGSGRVERPAFNRLVEMIDSAEVDLVLAVDLDRLSRGFKPYVKFYEACERARILVVWLGGQANFANGEGLLELEIRASFAREELRKIRSRTARKHQQLAEDGHDAGGGRPFGYEAGRHVLREPARASRISDRSEYVIDEPALIREAAARALRGEPLRTICWDWQRRGIPTAKGGRWSTTVMKRMLCSARISGRREQVRARGEKRHGPALISKADWEAIITVEESDRLRALLNAPDRQREAHPRKWLLSGFLRCDLCGKPLHTSSARRHQRRSYSCINGPGFSGGCGRLRINAETLEAVVVEMVFSKVDEGALAALIRARVEDPTVEGKLAEVDARLIEAGREYAATGGSVLALRGYTAELEKQRQALARQLEDQRRRLSLDGFDLSTPLRDEWPSLPLHRQRIILRALLGSIVIKPATHRGPVFDVNRIDPRWTV